VSIASVPVDSLDESKVFFWSAWFEIWKMQVPLRFLAEVAGFNEVEQGDFPS